MPSLEQLEATARTAEQRHDKAQQAAAAAREQAETERAQRLAAYDRALLDAFDDEDLGRDVRDAQRDLDEAVAGDRLGAAWVQLKLAQLRRAHLSGEAAGVATQLGDPRNIVTRPADSAIFEELGRAVDRVAGALHADEADARDAARDAAADG